MKKIELSSNNTFTATLLIGIMLICLSSFGESLLESVISMVGTICLLFGSIEGFNINKKSKHTGAQIMCIIFGIFSICLLIYHIYLLILK